MLDAFHSSLTAQKVINFNRIDLNSEQPPWYDEAVYNYLWNSDLNTSNTDTDSVSESIHYMTQHCQQFNQADLLVIAAPVWNSSVPAILKAWIDLIISPNHTYRFGPNGIEALHNIKRVLWLISSGGPENKVNVDNHFLAIQQSPFGYIGIEDMDVIWADKQEPSLYDDHQQQLESALEKINAYTKQLISNI